jgi:hypothetical protein
MCPTEDDSGILVSSVVVKVCMCGCEGGKQGCWGPGKGTKNEAVDSEHGTSKGSLPRTQNHHSK